MKKVINCLLTVLLMMSFCSLSLGADENSDVLDSINQRITSLDTMDWETRTDELTRITKEIEDLYNNKLLDEDTYEKLLGALFIYDVSLSAAPLMENEVVTYIERSLDSGKHVVSREKTINNYTIIDGTNQSLGTGFYILNSDVTFAERINISGDVKIILMDDYTLTVENGIGVNSGAKLTVYGQKEDSGRIIARLKDNNIACVGGDNFQKCGEIIVHGGILDAQGFSNGAIIGGGKGGNGGRVCIYGGYVKAVNNVPYLAESGPTIGGGVGRNVKNGGSLEIYGGSLYVHNTESKTIGTGAFASGTTTVTLGPDITGFGPNGLVLTKDTENIGDIVSSYTRSVFQFIGPESVEYIDCTYDSLNGVELNSSVSDKTFQITPDSTNLNEGMYFIDESLTVNHDLKINGNVGLIISDDCTLTINGGIQLNSDNALTIYGQIDNSGVLIINSGGDKAGIGGIFDYATQIEQSFGSLIIKGANITINHDGYGAGIGTSKYNGSFGSLKLYNGSLCINKKGGGSAIGGSRYTSSLDVDIEILGGNLKANALQNVCGTYSSRSVGGQFKMDKNICIYYNGDKILYSKSPDILKTLSAVSYMEIREREIYYIEPEWNGEELIENSKQLKKRYREIDANTSVLTDGWYLVDGEVEVSSLEVSGTANLLLLNNVQLTVKRGIKVSKDNTLNIYGESNEAGNLNIEGFSTAAIGTDTYSSEETGTINIYSGKIDARSSTGSGIGGKEAVINIYGGNISAYGANGGAGIGGRAQLSSGTINIYGGNILASGGEGGAGIGSGKRIMNSDVLDKGVITIYGGNIKAYGNAGGAGIGGGSKANGSSVVINGGYIEAHGDGVRGAGIGAGSDKMSARYGGSLTINGGIILAYGDVGIGGDDRYGASGIALGEDVCLSFGSDVKFGGFSLNKDFGTANQIGQKINEHGFVCAHVHDFDKDTGICNICDRHRSMVCISYNSLTLSGEIGVNYYFSLPDNMIGARALFSCSGLTANDKETELISPSANGYFRASYTTVAKEMHDNISLKINDLNDNALSFVTGGGRLIDSANDEAYDYSVVSYLQSAKEYMNPDSKLYALANAMNSYGNYTQAYLNYKTDTIVESDMLDLSGVDSTELETYATIISGNSPAGLTPVGVSLVVLDKTTIRCYFSSNNIEAYSFKVDGKEVTPMANKNYYVVDIAGISASDLDKFYTVTVDDEYSIKICALSYCNSALKNSTNTKLINLAKAIYLYNMAADQYFN